MPPARPLALPAGKWLKLNEGSPDGRLFPAEVLARAYRSSVRHAYRENRLLYRDPRGSLLLREKVATMLKSERGLAVTADNICITRGSQNAIYVAAHTLIMPGDTVLAESLTYEAAVAALASCGARIVSVGLDEEGVDVADVEKQCRMHTVKAIFLTRITSFRRLSRCVRSDACGCWSCRGSSASPSSRTTTTTNSTSKPSRCCPWRAMRRRA